MTADNPEPRAGVVRVNVPLVTAAAREMGIELPPEVFDLDAMDRIADAAAEGEAVLGDPDATADQLREAARAESDYIGLLQSLGDLKRVRLAMEGNDG